MVLIFKNLSNCFRELKMENFNRYRIPVNIQKLEYHKDTACMDDFEILIAKCRHDETSYIEAFTTMIYMEQAANSAGLRDFNLQNVDISLHSHADRTFKIPYNVSTS